MKSYKVYVSNGINGSEVVQFSLKRDLPKEVLIKDIDKLKAHAKTWYPKAERIEVMLTVPAKLPRKQLEAVGEEVASGWGASCTGFKCYSDSVEFQCIEHGEKFVTNLSYDDIKKEYGYCLK